jgi:hypothetical protein
MAAVLATADERVDSLSGGSTAKAGPCLVAIKQLGQHGYSVGLYIVE